jgi:TonB family protein
MQTFLNIAVVALLLSTGVLGQSKPTEAVEPDKYAADVIWARYKVSAAGASVMLPKLPTLTGGVGGDSCYEVAGNVYFAYADETLYEFRFVTKGEKPPLDSCEQKIFFGDAALNRRVREIENYMAPVTQLNGQLGDRKTKIFTWETINERSVRWVIPDLANGRWIELAISSRPDKKPDEKRFFPSLLLTSGDGIEVAGGSSSTLGDRGVVSKTFSPNEPLGATSGLLIKGKPRPGYTDAAREKNTQGTVILKVTFLANGGIGTVSVVKELPNGLTEQAVYAANRLSFLPARRDGVPITVIKQVEYSFSVY